MSTPKKSDTFETIKKYVVKDTLGQSCLLQRSFLPTPHSTEQMKHALDWRDCRRIYQVFLQKWDQVLKLQTDPHFHWHDEVHFHLLLTAGKKCADLWYCDSASEACPTGRASTKLCGWAKPDGCMFGHAINCTHSQPLTCNANQHRSHH